MKKPAGTILTVRCGGMRDGHPGACGREVAWVHRLDGQLMISGYLDAFGRRVVGVEPSSVPLNAIDADVIRLGCPRCGRQGGYKTYVDASSIRGARGPVRSKAL